MSDKLVAIVGPTASGKTSLSLQIAQHYNGEIIAADSRTVYRGMDIGTAKPSQKERLGIKHYGLDLVEPSGNYSASEFQKYARKCIDAIWEDDKLPIIVGGTGLYIDAVLYDYEFPPQADAEIRSELEKKSLSELVEILKSADHQAYVRVDLKNPRRVIRAIEVAGSPRRKASELPENWLVIGINPGMEQLYKNIAQRTKSMLDMGLVDEVKSLVERFGASAAALNSPGYSEIIEHFNGHISLAEAAQQINLHTGQLAKRQMTWFKRNKDIHWVENAAEGLSLCGQFLGGEV